MWGRSIILIHNTFKWFLHSTVLQSIEGKSQICSFPTRILRHKLIPYSFEVITSNPSAPINMYCKKYKSQSEIQLSQLVRVSWLAIINPALLRKLEQKYECDAYSELDDYCSNKFTLSNLDDRLLSHNYSHPTYVRQEPVEIWTKWLILCVWKDIPMRYL